jgi:hypothetical protein
MGTHAYRPDVVDFIAMDARTGAEAWNLTIDSSPTVEHVSSMVTNAERTKAYFGGGTWQLVLVEGNFVDYHAVGMVGAIDAAGGRLEWLHIEDPLLYANYDPRVTTAVSPDGRVVVAADRPSLVGPRSPTGLFPMGHVMALDASTGALEHEALYRPFGVDGQEVAGVAAVAAGFVVAGRATVSTIGSPGPTAAYAVMYGPDFDG